jgi:hypothetical protein
MSASERALVRCWSKFSARRSRSRRTSSVISLALIRSRAKARLGRRLAFARGNLSPGARDPGECPAAPAARCLVRRRRCVQLGINRTWAAAAAPTVIGGSGSDFARRGTWSSSSLSGDDGFELIVERKLRRRQLTDTGDVEISGRDVRERIPPAGQGMATARVRELWREAR